VTQPTFVPVADSAAVRPTVRTAVPEVGRTKKAGLLGAPTVSGGASQGAPGPDGGYALRLAEEILSEAHVDDVGHHDLVTGVAMLAAKRAALAGRGPSKGDVEVACDLFQLRTHADDDVAADRRRRFSGIGHSYFEQRRFVDDVPVEALTQRRGNVVALVHFAND
jgi:hypothetical protein